MRRIFFVVLIVQISAFNGALIAGDQPKAEDELTTLKRDYADVLTLQGTSKREILAIARILRAKPEVAIDQTTASANTVSTVASVRWFTSLPNRSAHEKTLCTSSTPPD